MGEERYESDSLKKQNPFRVPEGYMNGLTHQIMSQLPDKTSNERVKPDIPVLRRLRPWIVAAAALTGIVFFINVFIGIDNQTDSQKADSLWIQAEMSPEAVSEVRVSVDDEYLEYLEARYSDYILEEELTYSE